MYLKSNLPKYVDLTVSGDKHQDVSQGCVHHELHLRRHRYVMLASLASIVTMTVGALVLWARQAPASPVLVCYYDAGGALPALRLDPHLCTHINVAFAEVVNKKINMTADLVQALSDVVKLKEINSKLKILLSVGGAGGNQGFPDMIVDHKSRKIFIKSLKYILRNYSLDGVDLDWEFPGVHKSQSVGNRERQHFSQLLREIRMEYIREKRNYLLTVAAAAPQTIVDTAYDVDQLNMYVDFVNIMTYDFHYFTRFTPFTGLNSPLYARTEERLYLATLNVNYTVHMYLSKGLDKDKIVVGIPTYGHTFTLVNADNTAIGSPALGYGSLGSNGYANYPEICTLVKQSNRSVVIKQDVAARVPYLYHGTDWVSYDTPDSVMEKARYIREMGLRGAMIYSLNADDYEGMCSEREGHSKFPLIQAAKNSLLENILI